MSAFGRLLAQHRQDPSGRRWLFVPYDQLSATLGPLSREPARELGIVLVESPGKAATRPYHRQKLALVLTSLRHFAIEQAERGVAVRHVVGSSYAAALAGLWPLAMMRPAERELRVELEPLVQSGQITVLEHEGWLTNTEDFSAVLKQKPGGNKQARMDDFYRRVRSRLSVLMDSRGKPLGGRFSFDTENRKAWRGEPPAPTLPSFEVDEITAEVCQLIRERYAHHPGVLHPEALPASLLDVQRAWQWAQSACLPHFGPFEDAMSAAERSLFHSRISPLLNLQRLTAQQVLADVLQLELPLASKEGFVRQILGWREYMRHLHDFTDGFRVLDGEPQPCAPSPGDGGYRAWKGEPWNASAAGAGAPPEGGSLTSALGADSDVPPAYWGATSGLRCLDEVVSAVWEDAYSHHITRLMVLSNLAMLLDISPRALSDWFWVAYADAYDWVVEPNVHAMGTFGVGDRFTTKPYVSGAAYIDKMSDYCGKCSFDPKTTCPIAALYWAFLERHRAALSEVQRMKLPLAAAARRSPERRAADARAFTSVRDTLQRGQSLQPSVQSQASLPGIPKNEK